MKTTLALLSLCSLCLPLFVACDDDVGAGPNNADAGAVTDAAPDYSSGNELTVTVGDGRVLVSLDGPQEIAADKADSADWDLALSGYQVFTNSGPSGPGEASAFGPLDEATFLLDEKPADIPFLTPDKTGGAFTGWYFYDGTTHYLYSRFHTFGVKDGDNLWKVQVISYYGERNGGPVSALYKLRYAQVAPSAGEVRTLLLDGTAGGATAPASAPSGCIDLLTGTESLLTPDAASSSRDWHLCARRDSIALNGGESGPRGVLGVDLDEAKSASETLDTLQARTEAGTLAEFEAIDAASFTGKSFFADGPLSAFRDYWVDRTSAPPVRGYGAWLVKSAKSNQLYLVAFPEFIGATAQTPNQVVLSVKKVSGSR